MSNFVYTKFKNSLLKGEINFNNDSIKLLIVDNTYSPNQSTDEYVSSISTNSILARSNSISNKIITSGTFDASDLSISNYSGEPFNAVVLYKDTGDDNTSNLIYYVNEAEGLPFTGVNAQTDVTIQWNNALGKILSL